MLQNLIFKNILGNSSKAMICHQSFFPGGDLLIAKVINIQTK